MRSRQLFAAILALLASGCVDLSAISTNELWIVNESNVAVSGIVCLDTNRCFEYRLPAGKFVRTGLSLCLGSGQVGISVDSDGLVGVPYQPLSHAVACDGLSAIRIRTDGAGTLVVSIDSEFSASELRPTGDALRVATEPE
jgi:hypothetical protein